MRVVHNYHQIKMETIKDIGGFLLGSLTDVLFTMLLWGIVGFVLAIVLVILGKKYGLLERPRIWKIMTGCVFYVCFPVVFALFGALFGGVRGVQSQVIYVIEEAEESVAEYGRIYLPGLQDQLNGMVAELGDNFVLEELPGGTQAASVHNDFVEPLEAITGLSLNQLLIEGVLALTETESIETEDIQTAGELLDLMREVDFDDPAVYDAIGSKVQGIVKFHFRLVNFEIAQVMLIPLLLFSLEPLAYVVVKFVRKRFG